MPLVEALPDGFALRDYALLPAVHGELPAALERPHDARAALERAASPAGNERDRALMGERAERCAEALRFTVIEGRNTDR